MCGIAGIVHTDGRAADPAALDRMGNALRHRGPDGRGAWIQGSIGLAHRHLAIIDVHGTQQPLVASESACVLTFDGEIYNSKELRQTLEADGASFVEHSAAEVVLRAYERWGHDALERLDGMFAFALWNPRARQLFAARDRIGIKPFYYRWLDGTLAFASEMKAVLASDPDVPAALDPRSFDRYLRLQYVPGPLTIVEGIRQLPPGHSLTLTVDRRQLDEHRYWQARALTGVRPSIARFQRLLGGAVRSHMMADVPVGALLSGGVDSSLLVAHMVGFASAPVHTFSVGFEDDRFDERSAARRVAAHLGTVHHEQLVTDTDAAETLPRIIAAMDQPLADYAVLPTFLMARFAAQHVKVVLTGDGADELFGGSRRFRRDRLLAPVARLRPPYQPSHVFARRATSRFIGRGPSTLDRDIRRGHRAQGTLNRLLLRDLEGWLPDNLLVKLDRMTMLCGLEARVPYLDHHFVEWALGVPAPHTLSRQGDSDKRLLRQAAATMLPESIATRRKQSFMPPIDAWLRGRMRGLAHDTLLATTSHVRSRVDVRTVRRVLADHDRGQPNGERLWALLVYELWSQEYHVA